MKGSAEAVHIGASSQYTVLVWDRNSVSVSGTKNQGPILVSVSEPNFFIQNQYSFFQIFSCFSAS